LKLPNSESIVVNIEKVENYLLNTSHPDGLHKARFFMSFGFSQTSPREMAEALIKHSQENEVVETVNTDFGVKFVVEGKLQTPDKRNPLIRTIWFIAFNEKILKLVTAYPV